MQTTNLLNLAFLLLMSLTTATNSTPIGSNKIICKILSVCVTFQVEKNSDDKFQCQTLAENDPQGYSHIYDIDLPKDFVAANPALIDGESIVSIRGGKAISSNGIVSSRMEYYSDSDIEILNVVTPRFRNKRTHGRKNTLVVRVSSWDEEVTASREELSGRIFGIGEQLQVVNPSTQFQDCSFGKFSLQPAQGPYIEDGVIEVIVNRNTVGATAQGVLNDIYNKIFHSGGLLSGSAFDHVMLCMPPGVVDEPGEGFVAYAYVNHHISVYSDSWCSNLSTVMHEIGHNLGLHHSGDDEFDYADASGYMGWSSRQPTYPLSCFNGNKNWALQWYDDRQIELPGDLDSPWAGRLAAFVDYDLLSDSYVVIIKVGRLFLQYNRAKGINQETRERRDEVTVVFDEGENVQSTVVGSVASGSISTDPELRVQNFEGSGFDLVIEACGTFETDLIDYIGMSIHLDDGIQSSLCSQTNNFQFAPSATPTVTPMPSMTTIPSAMPSVSSMPTITATPTTSAMPSDDYSGAFTTRTTCSLIPILVGTILALYGM